jgi:hypothetical protein
MANRNDSHVWPMGDGTYLYADLSQSASPLRIGFATDDDCYEEDDAECARGENVIFGNNRRVHIHWWGTPYQTADASHRLGSAKALVSSYAESAGYL